MDETNQRFSAGIWLVKPGKENDFIAAWGDFAKWTFNHNPWGLPRFAYCRTSSNHAALFPADPGKVSKRLRHGGNSLCSRSSLQRPKNCEMR